MTHRYSTAISYGVLGGIGIYCVQSVNYPLASLPSIGYGLIITHSIMGIWKWGNRDHGNTSEKIYKWTKFLRDIFAFPCFIGQLYIKHGYPEMYGMVHPAVSLLPLLLQLKDDSVENDLKDGIMALNVISGAVVSILKQNNWGIATAISFGFQYFALSKGHDSIDIPPIDLCNYAFCFVCYFALLAFGA